MKHAINIYASADLPAFFSDLRRAMRATAADLDVWTDTLSARELMDALDEINSRAIRKGDTKSVVTAAAATYTIAESWFRTHPCSPYNEPDADETSRRVALATRPQRTADGA